MVILRDVSLLWSMGHTLVLFLFLFESRYSPKKTLFITLATMVPLTLVNLLLFALVGFEKYGTLMLVTLSLPSCIVFWLLAKHRDGRFFFTFCMVDTVVLEIIYIANILNHYLSPDSYLVMFFVRLVAYPLLDLLVYRKLRPTYMDVQRRVKRGWSIFALIGLLFYVVITLVMTFPDSIVNRPSQLPALALLFILMPVIYIHIILTLRRQQLIFEQAKQDSVMQVQVASVLARVNELGEANEAFRRERHDFRHKLKVIASLVEAKQYEELQKVLSEQELSLNKTRVVRYCSSAMIDAALAVYIKKAELLKIPVKMGFAFPETFEVNESELATALANALENAIHACMALPEPERFIEIKVINKPKFMVMLRNPFAGTLEFDEKGIPQSREEGHGYGTRIIAALCEKVGGYCDFQAEEGLFTLYMHLK